MNVAASPAPARAHGRHLALTLCGAMAEFIPPYVTNEEIEALLDHGRDKLAKAMTALFASPLPVAVVDTGNGNTVEVTLLADVLCRDSRSKTTGQYAGDLESVAGQLA